MEVNEVLRCWLAHVKGYPPDNTGVNEGQRYVTH